MKLPAIAFAAAAGWACALPAGLADATGPLDYTRRNEALAPTSSITPAVHQPDSSRILASAPVRFNVSTPEPAPMADRRAPIDVHETRSKRVLTHEVDRPAARPLTMNAFDGRLAPRSTATDAVHPPLVQKYQTGLSAAGQVSVGRLPAPAPGTTATFNRFVFRHNQPVPDPSAALPAGTGRRK